MKKETVCLALWTLSDKSWGTTRTCKCEKKKKTKKKNTAALLASHDVHHSCTSKDEEGF